MPNNYIPNNPAESSFTVVGVGASAGGIEAFRQFVRALPQESGMTYILLQDLHTDFEASLTSIIQQETKIPVIEITDKINLVPDHVYIVPSTQIIFTAEHGLQLSTNGNGHIHSIDKFLSALAESYHSNAIGIVLSGLGTDGSLGLKMIKDHGGITLAQDKTATFDAMPQHAINAGCVDFVLPPENMAKHLVDIHDTLKRIPSAGTNGTAIEDDSFRQVLALLRVRRGVDFTYYKQNTIRRRILRRIVINGQKSVNDYMTFLRSSKSEEELLYDDLLIPVTTFFRDPQTFDQLCTVVFPELLRVNDSLRIWVAGCSSGEEAYSLAIGLAEFIGESSSVKIQIFATDISQKNIDKARRGIYTARETEGVSEKRLNTYFRKVDGLYHVKKVIRDMCVFATHNFLNDPPFSRIDLVSCRNVLIYMDAYLQKKALNTFHYALREKGFLLLGKSETTGSISTLFTPVSNDDKLYVRKAGLKWVIANSGS